MDKEKEFTFEEIFKQNENRIHYYIHRLGVHDPHQEYYVEGIYAMWMAYKKYEPDKGPLSTYFNYTIKNRLIDMLRKKEGELLNEEKLIQEEINKINNGNRLVSRNVPLVDAVEIMVEDEALLEEVKNKLSKNQYKWVTQHLIMRIPLHEIAAKENVSLEAVKSWGREAKKKLREMR